MTDCPLCGGHVDKDGVSVVLESNHLMIDGDVYRLLPLSAEILFVLLRRAPSVVTTENIINSVWGVASDIRTDDVRWQIKKLCDDIKNTRLEVRNIYGLGYWLHGVDKRTCN